MNQIKLLILAVFVMPLSVYAQLTCADGRYSQPVYSGVEKITNIKYGWNIQPTAGNPNNVDTLYLDLYMPAGDSLTAKRPLMILAFGGSFIFGTKESPDIVELANRFARLGYVVASINYRLTTDLILNGSAQLLNLAVLKASHDMRGAVRFFRKDAATDNLYRIDPDMIIGGGVSAGSIAAIHMAYLDEPDEYPATLAGLVPGLGGVEGLSGSMGYSSKVAALVNLCGAIGDTAWIEDNDVPIVSVHGTADATVPYGSSTINIFGVTQVLDGSGTIHIKADSAGMKNELYTFEGADHVPFTFGTNAPQYMDTTFWFVRDFLAEIVCDASTAIEPDFFAGSLNIYPNPASSVAYIDVPDAHITSLEMFDVQGRKYEPAIRQEGNRIRLEKGNCPTGMYFLRMQVDDTRFYTGKLMIR